MKNHFIIEREYEISYSGIMKTSLDIPDRELADVMRFTKSKTKREAIVTAVVDFNRRQRMAALIRHSGKCTSLLSNEEIEGMEKTE
ncbi:MAG: DUF2191 domain-containing protein [Verrucomicrobia bacterium]|nr:DUF2191 domain-containing protein [Verrucomicrobiota bacterium]